MFVKEEILPQFIGDQGYFSTIFAFEPCHAYRKGKNYMDYDWPQPFDDWKKETFHNQKIIEKAGFEANIIENHDQPRALSKLVKDVNYQNDTGATALAATPATANSTHANGLVIIAQVPSSQRDRSMTTLIEVINHD